MKCLCWGKKGFRAYQMGLEVRIGQPGGGAVMEFGSIGWASEMLADHKFLVVSNLWECQEKADQVFWDLFKKSFISPVVVLLHVVTALWRGDENKPGLCGKPGPFGFHDAMNTSSLCPKIPHALVKDTLHLKQVTENFTMSLTLKMQKRLWLPDSVQNNSFNPLLVEKQRQTRNFWLAISLKSSLKSPILLFCDTFVVM